jgi:anti-sigma B factor antagonist
MKLSNEIIGTTTIVSIDGDIDASTYNQVSSYLLTEVSDGWKTLIIDFEGVPFMSSVGLHILVDIYKKAKRRGSDVVIAAPGRGVMRVLDTSGFSTFLTCYGSADDAKTASLLASTKEVT